MRADAVTGLAGEVDQDHFRSVHVVGIFKELLYQLRAAFAHTHAADSAVAGVAVGAQDHLAAAGHFFPGVLVNDGLVGGDVDAAVLLCGGKAEDVVVLVDGAAYGAEGVMTVGHGVGNGEAGQAAGPGGLDDTHIGDVVGHQGIEFDPHFLGVRGSGVGTHDLIGNGGFPGCVGSGKIRTGRGGNQRFTVKKVDAVGRKLDHEETSCMLMEWKIRLLRQHFHLRRPGWHLRWA